MTSPVRAVPDAAPRAAVRDVFDQLTAALHPLQAPPRGAPRNLGELEGLMPATRTLVPAAVLVGVVAHERPGVLFTVRNGNLRHHAGQVSFPGGRIEPDDAGPLAAALREAHEEIGLHASQVHPIGWLDPLATVTGFRVLPLVARIAPDVAPVADPREVAAVFEVPLAYLLDPGNLQRVSMTYRGQTRHVLEYLPHEGGARIWGATASMLEDLQARLVGAMPH